MIPRLPVPTLPDILARLRATIPEPAPPPMFDSWGGVGQIEITPAQQQVIDAQIAESLAKFTPPPVVPAPVLPAPPPVRPIAPIEEMAQVAPQEAPTGGINEEQLAAMIAAATQGTQATAPPIDTAAIIQATAEAMAQAMAQAQQSPMPEPPAPGLPDPTGLDWGMGGLPVGDMGMEGGFGPGPVYMQQYGLAGDWLTPYQRWQMGYAQPLHDVFQLQQQMGVAQGQPAAVWEDYLQPFQGGRAPAYGQAGAALGGLMGMGAEGRAGAGIDFGVGPLGQLANLLRLALRPHLGIHGAAAMARMLPRQRAQMHAGEVGGAAPVTFLDYLRQRFNLGRFGF